MRIAAFSLAVAFAAAQPLAAQPVLLAPPPPPGAQSAQGSAPPLATVRRAPPAAPLAAFEAADEDDDAAPTDADADDTLLDGRFGTNEEAEEDVVVFDVPARDPIEVSDLDAADPVDPADGVGGPEPQDVAEPLGEGEPTLRVAGSGAVARPTSLPLAATAVAATAEPPALAAAVADATLLTLTVEREIRAAPDQATVTVGVVNEAGTAQGASLDNARAMTNLLQALRRAGIADRDVQTSQLRLEPQYAFGEGQDPRLTGYQAVNTVRVLVRDLTALGPALDAAFAAGGNRVEGVSFGFSDPEPLLNQARREAVRRARERAELYAEAAGLQIQRIVAIQEGVSMPGPMPMQRMAVAEAAATPIAPGETTLAAAVTMTFALR